MGQQVAAKIIRMLNYNSIMIGENGNQGILPLAMIDLLSRAMEERRIKTVIMRLNYIEIYNVNIKNLLISDGKF